SGDDVGSGSGRRIPDDIQYGFFTQAGIKFGERRNQSAYRQTYDGGVKHFHSGDVFNPFTKKFHSDRFGQHEADQEKTGNNRQDNRHPVSQIQRTLHLVFFGIVGRYLNEKRSDDGSDNANTGNHQWQQNR